MFAGELKVERGVLKVLTNKSGHYKPGELRSMQVSQSVSRSAVILFFLALFPPVGLSPVGLLPPAVCFTVSAVGIICDVKEG